MPTLKKLTGLTLASAFALNLAVILPAQAGHHEMKGDAHNEHGMERKEWRKDDAKAHAEDMKAKNDEKSNKDKDKAKKDHHHDHDDDEDNGKHKGHDKDMDKAKSVKDKAKEKAKSVKDKAKDKAKK